MTCDDERKLRALTGHAWDLRGSPYLLDACQAILDWHDRRHVRRHEREQERVARLVRLMRETDPAALTVRRAA